MQNKAASITMRYMQFNYKHLGKTENIDNEEH